MTNGSEFYKLTDESNSTFDDIYDGIRAYALELGSLLGEGSLPRDRKNAWTKDINRLVCSERQPFKVAVVGRTGVGKSTLMNAMLRSPLLPSSAETACTSVITEISYCDSPDFVADIFFVSREDWGKELQILREDLMSDPTSANGDNDDSPAVCAKDRLFEVYPDLRNQPPSSWSVEGTLNHPLIGSLLGSKRSIRESDPRRLQDRLQVLLAAGDSSKYSATPSSSLWPLVQIAKISGRFAVLSTGVTLVDLPGHGDPNHARNRVSEDYLKMADAVLLVAPITRARAGNNDMRQYLRKTLTHILIDGRAKEGSITVVLTGADMKIGDREVKLGGELRRTADNFVQEAHQLRVEIKLCESKVETLKRQGGHGDISPNGEVGG